MIGKPSWRFLRATALVGLPLVVVVLGSTIVLPRESRSQAPAATADKPTNTAEWIALPIEDLRRFAYAGELRAMEELARRLVSGIGVPQDSQSGAGWLLRAAEAGSAGAAFNVGVMYERGFVVERDSTKAVEWYKRAADGNVAVAKHNLALLLREGKGAPRDINKAIELLRSAARQGMSASMFSLGDIYERGDAGPKDAPKALAWFAVTAEFERQTNHGTETPLAKTAQQRVDTLQRVLTPAELERAERLGQEEFQQILAALTPPKPEPLPPLPTPSTAAAPAAPAPDIEQALGWPKTTIERIRVIQQALIDLQRLNGKADGVAGPATRAAIREFEKKAGMRETGEASRELYVALLGALARRDTVARSPLPPPPPKVEPPPPPRAAPAAPPPRIELGNTEPPPPPPTSADIAKAAPRIVPPAEPPKPAVRIELPKSEPGPPPPTSAEIAKAAASMVARVEPTKPAPRMDLGKPDLGPPPPTSADIARVMPKTEPPKPDPNAWPSKPHDQVRAIQTLLRQLKLMSVAPTGEMGPITTGAIRNYQRWSGLKVTGEPSKELFESLIETRALVAPKPAAKPN